MRVATAIALLLALNLGLGCREAAEDPPAPVPAPPTPTAQPAVETELGAGDDTFRVLALTTCEAVVDREARNPRSHFPAGTRRTWAWFSVRNTESRGHVIVRWGKQPPFEHELRIHVGQNPRWRTWAPLDLGETPDGWWTVEIASPQGEMMASRRFFVARGGDDAVPR